MNTAIHISLSKMPLLVEDAFSFVNQASCGGNCLFVGTTRDLNLGEKVTHLDFEAYEPMALKELQKIAAQSLRDFDIEKVFIQHRMGHVGLMDKAVIIAVSAPHRAAYFRACSWIIDRLKEQVPIWKKEFLLDGSHWIGERP